MDKKSSNVGTHVALSSQVGRGPAPRGFKRGGRGSGGRGARREASLMSNTWKTPARRPMPVPQSSIERELGTGGDDESMRFKLEGGKQGSAFSLAGKKQGSASALFVVPRDRQKTLVRSEHTTAVPRYGGTVYEEARPVRGATYFAERPQEASTATVVCLYNEEVRAALVPPCETLNHRL